MNVLELRHVQKRFGAKEVLTDLNLRVRENTIYGFIGENGAGKTTTMKLILGLLKADGGEIRVNGEPVRYGQTKTNRDIGYLPDVPEFYGYLTPEEYLRLCGDIAGVPCDTLEPRTKELLSLVGLASSAKRRIGGFSRGMKQRLGIAQALIHRPKLLVCDEPTSALDPAGRKDIIDILRAIRGETTVLFSSHILPDIERVSDEIGLLHGGELKLSGRLEEIRQLHTKDGFFLEFSERTEATRFLAAFPGGETTSGLRLNYPNGTRDDMKRAFAILGELGLYPLLIKQNEPSLESLFLEVAGR